MPESSPQPLEQMLVLAAAAVLGLAVGSFLNVVIYRLPRGESVVAPGSRCRNCGHALSAFENVPVVSWLVLGGRCRWCRQPIWARYPLVELLTGALFALAVLEFGVTLQSVLVCAFAAALTVIAFIDLDHLVIPDSLNVVLVITALVAAVTSRRFVPAFEGAALAGALIGAVYLLTRGTGMGLGDVKLAAVMGLFLGYPAGPVAALSAFVIGAALAMPILMVGRRGRRDALPFGPFLVLGALIITYAPLLVYGPIAAYRSLIERHALGA